MDPAGTLQWKLMLATPVGRPRAKLPSLPNPQMPRLSALQTPRPVLGLSPDPCGTVWNSV